MAETNVKKKSPLWYIAGATVTTFVVLWIYKTIALNLSLFSPLAKAIGDYSMDDFYYQLLAQADEADSSTVVSIVDITDVYSRDELADLIVQVEEQGAKVLGIDCVFEGLKFENPYGDSLIAAVATSYDNIVFAYKLISDSWDGEQWTVTRNSFFADSLGKYNQGFIDFERSIYGDMKRNVIIADSVIGELRPSLCKIVADKYAGQEVVKMKKGDMRVNFSPTEFQIIPPDSIAEYGDYITDRVVFLGTMRDESDMHYTPQGKIAGVKLLAYSVETFLNQNAIKEASGWVLWLVSFLLVFTVIFIFDRYAILVSKLDNELLRYLLSSILVKGIIKFLLMAAFVWWAFILFCQENISVNLAYALAAIPFTVSAENLFNILLNNFKKK
ncbi:MAG: CHASE2 domain-containing protein [Prevotella sp.]|nr:CHASE2 domain-containing protein [Prevotella sp.]